MSTGFTTLGKGIKCKNDNIASSYTKTDKAVVCRASSRKAVDWVVTWSFRQSFIY